MATNPLVQEIHKIREEYASRFGNDLKSICGDARKKQGRDGRRVVLATPKYTQANEVDGVTENITKEP